jgi:serine/threonine-protein phosphatase 2A activator
MTSLPQRAIVTDEDLQSFLSSSTKEDFLQFISASGRSCAMKINNDNISTSGDEESNNNNNNNNNNYVNDSFQYLSPGLAYLCGVLDGLTEWIQDIPPMENNKTSQFRFGNPSFRKWHQRWIQQSPLIIRTLRSILKQYPSTNDDYDMECLDGCQNQGREMIVFGNKNVDNMSEEGDLSNDDDDPLTLELCTYGHDIFGHPIRLDYGTGHESSFQIYIYTLFRCGLYGNPSSSSSLPTPRRMNAATLALWNAYITVTNQLIDLYRLEPAGSHGVWGLDDYRCLSFFYGANQMMTITDSIPSGIYNQDYLQRSNERKESPYLYFRCIAFVQKLKSKAPLFETSPMLHDISQLPTWSKVASGLWKLYQGEVLAKRQVVQHWVFGSLFPATWTPTLSSTIPSAVPTTLFRDPTSSNTNGSATTSANIRAPWAK